VDKIQMRHRKFNFVPAQQKGCRPVSFPVHCSEQNYADLTSYAIAMSKGLQLPSQLHQNLWLTGTFMPSTLHWVQQSSFP
jgi:hypothetical protein